MVQKTQRTIVWINVASAPPNTKCKIDGQVTRGIWIRSIVAINFRPMFQPNVTHNREEHRYNNKQYEYTNAFRVASFSVL